ncbi:hypothetical protein POZ23_17145, partial [Bacteroides uniformis]|nr:hypothetical protein [Bacteroides uniformis]
MLFYRIQQAVSYRYNQEYIPRAGYFGTIYLCPHFRCSPKPALPARNDPYVIDASTELIDRIAQNDMVRGVTI